MGNRYNDGSIELSVTHAVSNAASVHVQYVHVPARPFETSHILEDKTV